MAVASISPAGLAFALRIDPPVDLDLSNLVDRLIAVTVSVCGEFSGPKTPVEVQDQAVIQMASYIFDAPESPPSTAWVLQKLWSDVAAFPLEESKGRGACDP